MEKDTKFCHKSSRYVFCKVAASFRHFVTQAFKPCFHYMMRHRKTHTHCNSRKNLSMFYTQSATCRLTQPSCNRLIEKDGKNGNDWNKPDQILRLKKEQILWSRNSFAVRFILEPAGELMFQAHPINGSASLGMVISWSVSCDVRFPPHPNRWQLTPPNPSRHLQEYSNL